jgi:cell division protein FtsB
MHSRWMVRVGLAALVAGALAVIPAGVNRGESIDKLGELSAELDDARSRRDALRADNARIRVEIRGLRGDRRAIEERARRDLGMVYPGEVVIIAPERDQ